MCGITGVVDYDRDLRLDGTRLRAMTQTMCHRGPDADGIWQGEHAALGHRRLSVIDVTGGKQPMTRGPVALTYCGEVFNYREVRAELQAAGMRFRTQSDTEVVLCAYLRWGSRFVEHLDGMFALGLWDSRTEQLLLARDRLGIKPLYFAPQPAGLLFGSEPKAIFASGLLSPAVDADGLRELFSLAKTPGEAVFRGMREVKPGYVITVSRTGSSMHQYWSLTAREHQDDLGTTIRTVRELLEDAVARHLVSDVPACVLLSGGVDSSILTSLGQRVRQSSCRGPLHSFTMDFQAQVDAFMAEPLRDGPDLPFARKVAEHAGTRHTTVLLGPHEVASDGPRDAALRARDLPSDGDTDASLYLLFRRVREQFVVALSGEGADELFGGYPWLHDKQAINTPTFPWVAMARKIGRLSLLEPGFVGPLRVDEYQAQRYLEAVSEVPRLPSEGETERRMRELSYLHLTRHLQPLLDRQDRIAMAVGLEIRVPYCDRKLVDYVFNVPWSMKCFDGHEKSLLRAAGRNILPAAVADRVKSPFPSVQDPGYHKILRDQVAAILATGTSPVLPLLNRASVRALAAMPASGSQIVRLGLERVIGLDHWLSEYRVSVQV
jgi:asparagine synthase (glutamine-hydrolysing)